MKKIMMIAVLALIAPFAGAEDMAAEAHNSVNATAPEDTSAAAVEVIEITEVEAAEVVTDTVESE